MAVGEVRMLDFPADTISSNIKFYYITISGGNLILLLLYCKLSWPNVASSPPQQLVSWYVRNIIGDRSLRQRRMTSTWQHVLESRAHRHLSWVLMYLLTLTLTNPLACSFGNVG